MSLLQRFLGIGSGSNEPDTQSRTVRRITAELAGMPEEQSHYLAAFAYVLARVAHADLKIEEAEVQAMIRATSALADLDEQQARLVVDLAREGAQEMGGSENFLVTREFRRVSTREQRIALVECLFAVSAADGTISTTENAEVVAIGEELGLDRSEVVALRSGWKEHLAEFQAIAARNS
jgi:uncharacterized tellurite resistance protein B-like protein